MTLKPFKLLAILVGAGLLVVALMSWFSIASPRIRNAPLSNGYADFIRAGQTIVPFPVTSSPDSRADLQSHLATNAGSLRLIEEGLGKECLLSWGPGTNRIQQHMDELASFKQLARLLEFQARLAELDGRTNEAALLHLKTIRFGNEVVRGGVGLDKLLGLSIENLGAGALEKLVPHLDAPTRREIAGGLGQIDARRESAAEVLRQEAEWRRANSSLYQRVIFALPIPAMNPLRRSEKSLVGKMNQQKTRQDQLRRRLTD